VELRGSDILKLLVKSAEKNDEILQISGLKVVINSSLPKGHRVISATMDNGKPLEPEKIYKVATVDYLPKRGGNFQVFKKARIVRYDDFLFNVVKESVQSLGTIYSAISGRLTDIGSEQ